ncbi:MAG: 3-dehydroquinate dehydratase [Oscillospiraceae bacterium]|jgi:3-dehydroquinate dehydratase-2|nr:3-dehydroquinate dehydratase [Oscillospiraceae bacterium]
MHLLILNGPNLNLLGLREPALYGAQTYAALCQTCEDACRARDVTCTLFQSNHEGALVDAIQDAYGKADGIVLNPAAYTHTSVAILDALKAVHLPAVEVHLTAVAEREPFRHVSFAGLACEKTITGQGFAGYVQAIDYLAERYGASNGQGA